jgi:ABC-type multidrug transport system ATPase subunit
MGDDTPEEWTKAEQSAAGVAPTFKNPGVTVTFTDLSYSVKIKKKDDLHILSSLSGCFEAGRMTALMGPSGSGKTTLMDLLASRKTNAGISSGEILFAGNKLTSAQLQHNCGYVEQFDTLVGELTVQQMLMYTAELKLPSSMSKKDKEARVDEIISKLRLEKCRNSLIGNPLRRSISGGQAKRVNIGCALVTSPKVIFLDEPTSGLDTRMANEVIMILKSLANEGCCVVATVHAPSSFAFSLFDDLLMLQQGGRVVYRGAVGSVQQYFESNGLKFPGNGYSLPDWLVEVTSGATSESLNALGDVDKSTNAEDVKSAVDFAAAWESSAKSKACDKEIKDRVDALKAASSSASTLNSRGPGQLKALQTLLAYRMSTHYKDGEFLGPRIGDKIFMSLLTLSLYWGIGEENDPQSIQSVTALLYFFAALCGYGAAAFVPSLTLERGLFYRERADGCYMAFTYYLAKFIEEAVLCIVTSFLFSVIVFWGIKLQGSFIIFVAVYYMTTMLGIVLAYAVAAVAPNMEAANALLPTYVTICMYFGGFFLLFEKIPTGWQWFSYTSFLRYSWGALMLNNYEGSDLGTTTVFVSKEGEQQNVLQFYGLDDGIMSSMGGCAGILAAMIFIFAGLGALGVAKVSHIKR